MDNKAIVNFLFANILNKTLYVNEYKIETIVAKIENIVDQKLNISGSFIKKIYLSHDITLNVNETDIKFDFLRLLKVEKYIYEIPSTNSNENYVYINIKESNIRPKQILLNGLTIDLAENEIYKKINLDNVEIILMYEIETPFILINISLTLVVLTMTLLNIKERIIRVNIA
jgi:hypothetical protein